jgi:hypothetical protein
VHAVAEPREALGVPKLLIIIIIIFLLKFHMAPKKKKKKNKNPSLLLIQVTTRHLLYELFGSATECMEANKLFDRVASMCLSYKGFASRVNYFNYF